MQHLIPPADKIFSSLEDALPWREKLRKAKLTLSVTNGCFDILHRGHAEYLWAARNLGDRLLILLNSDESVRALKGPSRPINNEYDRAFLLASFEFVDAVMVFRGARCHAELGALAPDFYAKGGDYTIDTLDPDERAALLRNHTEVSFIPFVPDHSTSAILRKSGQCS